MTETGKIASLTWSASSIKCTRLYPSPNIIFSAEVPSNGFKSNDKGGKKLARKLSKQAMYTSVQVELRRVGRESDSKEDTYLYDLQLLLSSAKDNVLQKLCDRFGDEIKFSVSLKHGPVLRQMEVLSTEQMNVRSGKCICRLAMTSKTYSSVYWNAAELTIKIDVPDNLAGTDASNLISQQPDEARITQTILDEEILTDLVISAGNGAKINAHQAFLSAASPVFRATFKNKMKESLTGTLDMTDMSEKSVRAFLRFIYSGDVTGPKADVEIAYDLLYAAHKYHMPELESLMVSQLLLMNDKDFTVELALTIYSFIRLWDSYPTLKKKMIWILMTNWNELKKLPAYQELKENSDLLEEFCEEFIQENAASFKAELSKNGVPLSITGTVTGSIKKKKVKTKKAKSNETKKTKEKLEHWAMVTLRILLFPVLKLFDLYLTYEYKKQDKYKY